MNEQTLRALLNNVAEGKTRIEDALTQLNALPFEDLGYAKIDHHRALRKGMPEVVFCQGKTPEQVGELMSKIYEKHGTALGTRANSEHASAVLNAQPTAKYDPISRCITIGFLRANVPEDSYIAVVSAGTSDIPVAEEAASVCEFYGCPVQRLYDVGVAGIHRLLDNATTLMNAKAIIVAAGMEGALASVVGGLVKAPVIAVPTSIGYGASFNGLAALLAMLNTCAPGVVVVNIDNGFGAGYFASMLLL